MGGELLVGTERGIAAVVSVGNVPVVVETVGVCSIGVTPLDGLNEALRAIPALSMETIVSWLFVQDDGGTLQGEEADAEGKFARMFMSGVEDDDGL